jgi:hypothetical protein
MTKTQCSNLMILESDEEFRTRHLEPRGLGNVKFVTGLRELGKVDYDYFQACCSKVDIISLPLYFAHIYHSVFSLLSSPSSACAIKQFDHLRNSTLMHHVPAGNS